MKKDDRLYLIHIKECIDKIDRYSANGRAEFFGNTLGKALSRPPLFPIPAFGVRLLFGEMADALLLSGQRVEPGRLKLTGYQFQYSQLQNALHRVLEKSLK